MYCDIILEKDALSSSIFHFSFKLTKRILTFKTPGFYFQNFYISSKTLHLFLKLSSKKISGTSTPSVLKYKLKEYFGRFWEDFLDEVVASLKNRQKYERLISELTFKHE